MKYVSLASSQKAKEILESLKIRNPSEIHIRDIAMERGAYVRERGLEGSEAWLVRKRGIAIITIDKDIPEEGRKRFAIAHELGHFELHCDSQLILCTEQDMFVWNENKSQEMEANDFAAHILMPDELFAPHTKHNLPDMRGIGRLAGEFRTTLTATALRYVQASSEPCAVAICKDGIIKWYKPSKSFNYHLKVGEKLSPDSYAFDFYDGIDLPDEPDRVPAYAWLSGTFDAEAQIVEHSVALSRYGIALSLLWIDTDVRPVWHKDEEEPEFDLTNPFTPDGKRWQW